MWLIFLLFLFASSKAMDLNLTGKWLKDVGGEIIIRWRLEPEDRLQSVKLQQNNVQLMDYRPEVHGRPYKMAVQGDGEFMHITCIVYEDVISGLCIVLTNQPTASSFYCEVSGERPYFRTVYKNYQFQPFVESSAAHIEEVVEESKNRVVLNCSSHGLPVPYFKWSINDQIRDGDTADRYWNASSKLWHSWSTLILVQTADKALLVKCSPKQTRDSQLITYNSRSAEVRLERLNGAEYLHIGVYKIILAITMLNSLLR